MTKNLFDILATTKNDYLLKELTSQTDGFQCDNLTEALKSGYSSRDPGILRNTTLFNSAFTHRSLVFLMTNRSFEALIKNDLLNKQDSCNSTSFRDMVRTLIRRGFVNQLRKGRTGKAGLFEIVQPDLVSYMKEIYIADVTKAYVEAMDFDKVYAEKKQDAIDYWEGDKKEEDKLSFKEEYELFKKEQDGKED